MLRPAKFNSKIDLIDSVADYSEHVVDNVDDSVLHGNVRNENLGPHSSTTEVRIAFVDLRHRVY